MSSHQKRRKRRRRRKGAEKNDDSKYCDNITIYISLNRSGMVKVLITPTQQASEPASEPASEKNKTPPTID